MIKNNLYVVNLPYVDLKNGNKQQKEVLNIAKKKFGSIPNLYKNMTNYPALTETYLNASASFRVESGFTLQEVETIFLAINFENNCDYCMAGHSFLGQVKAQIPKEIIEQLREGKELSDSKLNTLKDFTVHMLRSKGWPLQEETQKFLDAGYTEKHILAIIHAISIKTISNYVNHVFNTELDKPLKAFEWKPLLK